MTGNFILLHIAAGQGSSFQRQRRSLAVTLGDFL
jgi:hypothetical protein